MSIADSIDSIRRADIAYDRLMDSIVRVYDEKRKVIEIEKAADNVETDLATGFAIGTLVIIFGSFFVYNFLNNRYWERGVFPPFMLNRRVNKYEAVLNLAVNIIRHDRDSNREKIAELQRYLYSMFPDLRGNMSDSYTSALAQPVSTVSVCKWLKPKLSLKERNTLFELLFEIAISDGKMGQREYAELLVFCRVMGLSEADLAQKTADHKRRFAEQLYEEQRKRSETITHMNNIGQKEKHLSVFGLSDGFSEVALKKAYRVLVKSCHPDMTREVDSQEKEILNQRFLEIQEAYEYLLKIV